LGTSLYTEALSTLDADLRLEYGRLLLAFDENSGKLHAKRVSVFKRAA
jgi:hypothetical protein